MNDFEKKLKGIKFDVTRNIMYHGAREGFYGGLHKSVMFLTTFFGTGAAIVVLKEGPELLSVTLGLLVAVASTLDLVIDLSGSARLHNGLRQRYFALMGELEDCVDESADLSAINKRIYALYGEEPPQLRALDAICWNQTRLALYPEVQFGDLIHIKWNESFFRHVWAFSDSKFQYNSEIQKA